MSTLSADDRLRATHRAALRALDQAESFPDGVRAVLRTVCSGLGWAGGEFWQVGTDHTVERLVRWCTPDLTGSPLGDPVGSPEHLRLPRATGLPAAVWASNDEPWIGDLATEPGDPRRAALARDCGLGAVVTVPVPAEDSPGVLLFLTRDLADASPALLFALQSIGARVGLLAQRCRSRDRLHEERRRLERTQRIARVGSWEWDIENDVVAWSDLMFELYGVDPAEFTADEANYSSIHPDDVEALGAGFRQCVDTGTCLVRQYRVIRRSDGETRTFEARGEPLAAESGRPARIVGTAMDVTERIAAQRQSADRETMLHSILANSQSLIYVKDLEGRYLMVNAPMQQAFSVTEEELLGKDDSVLDPQLAPVWRANDLQAQRGELKVEEWFDGPQGRSYYESVKFPLLDATGKPFATCGISVDVTARREAEAAMITARDAAMASTEAKSSFLATMSHEIRTPMNAVIGMTDLLLDTDLDPRQLEYVETIRTSGDALLMVINDILDYSRIEAGEMELESRPFDLHRCVEDSLLLVAPTAPSLDLVTQIDRDCPAFVLGDVNRLRQVLVNLVGNAVKFTREGDVLVSVSVTDPSGPDDPQPEDGDVVLRFSVRDTGIGIPAERMDRVFQSFSQVDASTTRVYGGSGLGLAISQAIVRAMAGEITVTSILGQGSTFSFEIRLHRCLNPPAELTERHRVSKAVDLSGRRVLVVDDNDTNRRILRIQLETWGMSCTAVASARDALALLAAGPGFDIAILDMHMPETDGVQLAGQIRRMPALAHLPLVLLTSLATKPRPGETDLFTGFHTKPIRAGALRLMLSQILTPEPAAATLPVDVEVAPTAAGLRVLLAEDNLVNQMVAQRLLHNLGHYVDIVADGEEALAATLKRDYDVVLMDIHMPNLDGLGAARAIRSRLPSQRQPQIVAMTASSLPEDRRACLDAGMNGYLLKPVRMLDLVESLRSLAIGTPHPPDSPALPPAASVDLAVLTQLARDMGATSAAGLRALIEAYVEQGDGWMLEITAAARGGDAERVRTIAHTLGSSSALLGAQTLADLLAEAGRVARSEDEDLLPAVAAATIEYRQVVTALLSDPVLAADLTTAGEDDR